MAPDPRWSAVVVNYEAGDALRDCVASLLADTSAGAPEIVVVDNGSTDGSIERLLAAYPTVPVVATGANLGDAGAASRGIAATAAPVVAVCNPDLLIDPGTAAAMVCRLDDDPRLAAVGPAIFEPDGTHYPSARQIPRLHDTVGHAFLGAMRPSNRFTRRYRELDRDPSVTRAVDWVSGAAIWLRRTAIDAVGGWDDEYFMYVEDVDLCWRLTQEGWAVAYEPAGRVTHVQGLSTRRHPYRMIVAHHRSLLRFAGKRWRGPKRILLAPAAVFLAARAAGQVVVARFARPAPRRGRSEVAR